MSASKSGDSSMRWPFLALVVLVTTPAAAQSQQGPFQRCQDLGTLISSQALTSSRSFSWDGNNRDGGLGLVSLWVEFTDANASITRLRTVCTVSIDGNSTDYTPQECTSSSGTYTCVNTGTFDKGDGSTGPGTLNFPLRLDVESFPDFECTFSAQSGSPATADVITVKGRLCTKG